MIFNPFIPAISLWLSNLLAEQRGNKNCSNVGIGLKSIFFEACSRFYSCFIPENHHAV